VTRVKILTLFVLIFSALSGSDSYAETLTDAVKLLNGGNYKQAKAMLNVLQRSTTDPIEKAVILKNLGTCNQKLNEDYLLWTNQFDEAVELITNLSSIPEKELAIIHFQKANCLINSAFTALRNSNLSGISENDRFNIIKFYLSPAEKSLSQLKEHRSKGLGLASDIKVLKADIKILMQLLTKEKENQTYLRKILNKTYGKALQNKHWRDDIRLYALIRKIAVLRNDGQIKKTIKLAQKALKIESENLELNLEAKLQYAAAKLVSLKPNEGYQDLERFINACIVEVESLRRSNIEAEQFLKAKQFFSQRTSAYELLLDLYNKFDKNEEMLITIDQMKARTFKEFVIDKSPSYPILNLKDVQKNLKENNAIAVEYFLGFSKSWLFIITPESVIKHHLDISGQQIVHKTKLVLSGYRNTQLLRHYKSSSREPEKFQTLLATYQASHELYNQLLKPLEEFNKDAEIVYFIPHDVINYLPFSALIEKLDHSNLLQSEFYSETAPPISYVPSLSLLTKKLNPRYTGKSRIFYQSHFSGSKLYNLPYSNQQAQSIAQITKGKLFSGDSFSTQELTDTQSANLIYISSHVKHYDSSADNAIVLGDKGNTELSVNKLINECKGQIKANLGVLCLCGTNVGEVVPLPGDDLATLSRALLITGCRSVITSQWNVTDKETPMILKEATINYTNGLSAAKSLDLAIKKYLKEVPSQFYRHPFYWGNLLVLEKEMTR